jgi:hypothetical protein
MAMIVISEHCFHEDERAMSYGFCYTFGFHLGILSHGALSSITDSYLSFMSWAVARLALTPGKVGPNLVRPPQQRGILLKAAIPPRTETGSHAPMG